VARKPIDTFSTEYRRRKIGDAEAFSAEDIARYEAMRTEPLEPVYDERPPVGDRWSIWDQSEHLQKGPEPRPDWVITDSGAVDYELGVLKTGKEADVFLIERTVPDSGRSAVLASKRYRSSEHTQFNRAGDYMAGRGTRRSRDRRALEKKTTFGLAEAAGRWASAEFDALRRLYLAGVAVPYPVQIYGTEVIMEFIGTGRTGAPRLAETRPDPDELADLWDQTCENLRLIVEEGFAHGDLSAYNTVVDDGRLVLLDLPQVVDLYANPLGFDFLTRDIANIGAWFTGRGLAQDAVDALTGELLSLAAMP
jgi:RIO kinase 1